MQSLFADSSNGDVIVLRINQAILALWQYEGLARQQRLP
jgi:hypothetical protein